jgi:hypothetical protein
MELDIGHVVIGGGDQDHGIDQGGVVGDHSQSFHC